MQNSDMKLDTEAIELYRQFDGVEFRQLAKVSGDGFSQGLTEAERQNDAARMLLAEIISQVSDSLLRFDDRKKRRHQKGAFADFKRTTEKLIRSYASTKNVLIRYKGNYEETGDRKNIDYEIVFGKYYLDLSEMKALAGRRKWEDTSRIDQLSDAFETLWNRSIHNLLLRLPGKEKEYKRLWIGLQILYRYQRALEKKSQVEFKMSGKQFSYPLVTNESGRPDPNLTLLAIFNRIPSAKIQTLVEKVIRLSQQSESAKTEFAFTTTYDAILGLKKLRGKLNIPPLEVNNVKWLIVDSEQHQITNEMARVARYVVDNYNDSVPEASGVLKSVYGDDYERINSNQVAQRLTLTSDLLTRMDQHTADKEVEDEVLENVWSRLGLVNDGIYDNLVVEENRIEAHTPGEKTFIAKVHDKLVGLVGFYKHRSITKKKMADMVHQVIDFDQQDYDTIAKDFEISDEGAKELIRTLKSCFNDQGHFRKSIFVNAIPDLERYESKIFDFLWHNLKETLHQSDRPAFLDALQMLVDRISQRKNSLSVLLKDMVANPSVVRFADHKAFMLGNRLVRRNTGSIVSYQITPEDVLKDLSGLDQPVANYAAWKVDREQEPFYQKMRTIHRRLIDLLDSDDRDGQKMSAKDLFALEREAYLFFSQCGGSTGWSVLMSALKEYGHPGSDIYNLKASKRHFADLLQLLKIVIRGIGVVGGGDERVLIESVVNRLGQFSELAGTMHEEDLIIQIREVAEEAVLRMDAADQ